MSSVRAGIWALNDRQFQYRWCHLSTQYWYF